MFEPKHIRAILRDAALRKILLSNKAIPLEKYNQFEKQLPEMQDEIVDSIDNVLQAYAPIQLHYSSPFEHLPDDAWIYGTKGIYVVRNQDGSVLFSRKIDAVRYANSMSSVSLDIADGLV